MGETEQKGAAAELVEAGEALRSGDWERARTLYEGVAGGAGAESAELAEAWEGLGWVGYWLSDAEATFRCRESAFHTYFAAGRPTDAARVAAYLAADHREFRWEPAISRGWHERARNVLEGVPESADHGLVDLLEAEYEMAVEGNFVRAIELCDRAVHLGKLIGSTQVEALGLAGGGVARVYAGECEAGLRSLDAGLAMATTEGAVNAHTLAWSLCCMISACEWVGDLSRATQWCDQARDVFERWGGRQILGVCRSVYGTVLTINGDWGRADDELREAINEFNGSRPALAGSGLLRLAELRLRQGRFEETRALLGDLGPAGTLVEGELALKEGSAEDARALAERVLRQTPDETPILRLPALELRVRAACAEGHPAVVAATVAEVEKVAAGAGTPYFRGRGHLARGRFEAALASLDAAREACEDAIDCFLLASAPYDAAIARFELAKALARLGRSERAEDELAGARKTFEALGAAADLAAAEEPLPEADAGPAPGECDLTPRELEILRLIARGMSDARIAEELFVSPHTVHRHVANVRTKLGLASRAAAVAYASREGLI